MRILYRSASFLLAAAWLLHSPPSMAEPSSMTMQQVVDYSLQNNGHLKAFRQEVEVREAGRVKAGLLPNPTLDLEAASGALTGSSSENSLALGLSQEFALGGKRAKRQAVADLQLQLHRWQLADRERLLREEVKSVFCDALLAREQLALADRAISLNRQLLEVARERLAAGDIPELEMNLVKVELARSEGERHEAATALLQAQERLWTMAGLPSGSQPAVEGALESGVAPEAALADLKQRAAANRPDLRAMETETAMGEAELQLARAGSVPDLTAGLVLRRDTTSMEIGGVEGKDTAYTVGVRLSLPIPLFDRNQAEVREAGARKSGSEARVAATAAVVAREVESAHALLQSAASILVLYRTDIMPQLQENLELVREAYRLGEVGVLEVIQEQKKFHEVNNRYLTALHDRQTALVKLESVTATEFAGGVQ